MKEGGLGLGGAQGICDRNSAGSVALTARKEGASAGHFFIEVA